MKNLRLLSVAAIALLAGCAPAIDRGSVAMKITNNEAHVCLGKGEVSPGDRIALIRNVCTPETAASTKPGRASPARCERQAVGKGTIKEVLSDHYSVATIDSGIDYREGDIVEKVAS